MKASPDDRQVPCPPLPDTATAPAPHGSETVPNAPGGDARDDVVLAATGVPRPANANRASRRPVGFRIGKAMFVHLPHDGCATCGRDFEGQFARTRGHFRPRRATGTFPAELRHDRTRPHHQSRYWSWQCRQCNARQGNHTLRQFESNLRHRDPTDARLADRVAGLIAALLALGLHEDDL